MLKSKKQMSRTFFFSLLVLVFIFSVGSYKSHGNTPPHEKRIDLIVQEFKKTWSHFTEEDLKDVKEALVSEFTKTQSLSQKVLSKMKDYYNYTEEDALSKWHAFKAKLYKEKFMHIDS